MMTKTEEKMQIVDHTMKILREMIQDNIKAWGDEYAANSLAIKLIKDAVTEYEQRMKDGE